MRLIYFFILIIVLSVFYSKAQAKSSSWYLSSEVGKSKSLVTEVDINRLLRGNQINAKAVNLSTVSDAWAWHLGYQLASQYSVEFGYLDIGNRGVEILGSSSSEQGFYRTVSKIHPNTGSGATLAISGNQFIWQQKLLARIKLGYFFWQGKFKSSLNGERLIPHSQSGKDFWAGMSLEYLIDPAHRVTLNYKRVELNQQANNLVTIGVSYSF